MSEGASSSATGELTVLSADPLCAGAALAYLEDWVTPTRRFFIRNHFNVPSMDVSSWILTVWGEVEKPLTVRYDDLARLPSKELVALLECAGNSRATMRPPVEGVPWDNGAVGTARWTGVPLRTVLEQASPRTSAKFVLFEGADFGKERTAPGALAATECSYAMSLPIEKAMHPDTLLVHGMNGDVLSPEHGHPVRLLVPGWYGMASVKWLTNIRVLDKPFRGFHETDYYVFVAEGETSDSPGERVTTLRIKSLITWPSRGGIVPTGSHRIRGVAWSGHGLVSRVEVSTDNGRSWHLAALEASRSPYAWRQWEFQWQVAKSGYYLIRARAIDEKGHAQPEQAPWNFRGYAVNSVHVVPVTVIPAQAA